MWAWSVCGFFSLFSLIQGVSPFIVVLGFVGDDFCRFRETMTRLWAAHLRHFQDMLFLIFRQEHLFIVCLLLFILSRCICGISVNLSQTTHSTVWWWFLGKVNALIRIPVEVMALNARCCFDGLLAHIWLAGIWASVTKGLPKQVHWSLAIFLSLLDKLPYRQTVAPWFLQEIKKLVSFLQV